MPPGRVLVVRAAHGGPVDLVVEPLQVVPVAGLGLVVEDRITAEPAGA